MCVTDGQQTTTTDVASQNSEVTVSQGDWARDCKGGGAEFSSRGGVQGGWVGGAAGGTPPAGDPELLEAPKAAKKFFGLN